MARPSTYDALPLAETKLLPPRLRPELVVRTRVQAALDRDDVKLTLVAAPPGYGKTVAARTRFENAEGAVAWVTLDAGDNDPMRFWTYAATAIERVRGGLGRGALQRLKTPGGVLESAVIELVNGIATYAAPLTLVLDDFQAITDLECLESIDYALEHLPPTTRLIVITRSDPSLHLAQLRARGELAEDTSERPRLYQRGGHRVAGRARRASSSSPTRSRCCANEPKGGRERSAWHCSGCAASRIRMRRCASSAVIIASWPTT